MAAADLDDTIVALATPPGRGGRAIVRLSGPQALALATSLFHSNEPIEPGRHKLWEGAVRLPGLHAPFPAQLYHWHGPRSYTGQDVVELHTLSCPPLVELMIAELLNAGGRAARPGEFTMRAFLAGKLDLTRAEAVHAVIEAGSRDELQEALAQMAGGVSRPLQTLRDDLLNLLADVEAGLDFAEENIAFVATEALLNRITKGLALVTLVGKQVAGRSVAGRPFRAVLVGRPNAGKSSLFNALAGRSAALVSPEPGTTRDYLIQSLDVGGIRVDLVDTAGWQPSEGEIVAQAQELGRGERERADLVLLCMEAGRAADAEEAAAQAENLVRVATKCDAAAPAPDALATSAVTGQGLDTLRSLLGERARSHAQPALAPSLSRCRHHVDACLAHLRRAHELALFEEAPELLALELRGALDELGAMVGAVYTDDLLDRIFSRFCIGK